MSKGKTIGGTFLIVVGSILMILGLLGALLFIFVGYMADSGMADESVEEKMWDFKRHALSTEGVITDVDLEEGVTQIRYYSEIDGKYYPITMYAVLDDYRAGDKIEVYYDMDDPADFMLPAAYEMVADELGGVFFKIGTVAGVVGVVGLIMMIIGIVLINRRKKQL